MQKWLTRSRRRLGFAIAWALEVRGAHWCYLANTIEPSVCGGDAACSQITLTTCYYNYYRLVVVLLCCEQIEDAMLMFDKVTQRHRGQSTQLHLLLSRVCTRQPSKKTSEQTREFLSVFLLCHSLQLAIFDNLLFTGI